MEENVGVFLSVSANLSTEVFVCPFSGLASMLLCPMAVKCARLGCVLRQLPKYGIVCSTKHFVFERYHGRHNSKPLHTVSPHSVKETVQSVDEVSYGIL